MATQRFQWKNHRISVHPASPAHSMFALAAPGLTEVVLEEVALRVDLPDLSGFPKPIDKAQILLETAAEIEHALLIQYLYSALSIRPEADFADTPSRNLVRDLRLGLLGVAREEMGHLLTVQNLLHLAGLKSNLEREDFPFREDLYPFRLNLEPLNRNSLAKYVVAEMPEAAGDMTRILQAAEISAGAPINRVGTLYALLGVVFTRSGELDANAPKGPWYVAVQHTAEMLRQTGEDLTNWHLPDESFAGAARLQAIQEDWGDDTVVTEGATDPGIRVHSIADRSQSLDALRDIGQQGEGPVSGSASGSHFQRFRALWDRLDAHQTANPGFTPARPVPVNPVLPAPGAPPNAGAITHVRTKQWAVLCNLRYEILLRSLHHFLQLEGPCYLPFDAASPAAGGDRTPRGFLNLWVFDEMRRIGKIGARLAGLPRTGDENPDRAGAPFALPDDISNLHAPGADLWGLAVQVRRKAVETARALLEAAPSASERVFLEFLAKADETAIQIAEKLRSGQEPAVAKNYLKVVQMLEEAVRGFDVPRAHRNFWRGITRDRFVAFEFGDRILQVGDPQSSPLVHAIRGTGKFEGERMPRRRPPVPESRIAYLEHWIAQNCPDSEPPGQAAQGEPTL